MINMAMRMVTGLGRTTKQSKLMQSCNWMDIGEITTYYSLVQMWKYVKWNISGYMEDKLSIMDEDKISTSHPRLQITARAYRHRTTESWNLLPHDLRYENAISKFKAGVKNWIKEQR